MQNLFFFCIVDNTWFADLEVMQLITKYNTRVKFWQRINNIYSKYTWIIPWKGKNALQSLIECVLQGSEFYNE